MSAEAAWLQPPDEQDIGPCAKCPGMCSIEEHWESDISGEAGCVQHPECVGFVEYTRADHLADQADRLYSLFKERAL